MHATQKIQKVAVLTHALSISYAVLCLEISFFSLSLSRSSPPFFLGGCSKIEWGFVPRLLVSERLFNIPNYDLHLV